MEQRYGITFFIKRAVKNNSKWSNTLLYLRFCDRLHRCRYFSSKRSSETSDKLTILNNCQQLYFIYIYGCCMVHVFLFIKLYLFRSWSSIYFLSITLLCRAYFCFFNRTVNNLTIAFFLYSCIHRCNNIIAVKKSYKNSLNDRLCGSVYKTRSKYIIYWVS